MNDVKSVVMRIFREWQMPPVKWSIDFRERAPSLWSSGKSLLRHGFAFLPFCVRSHYSCSAQTHYPTVRSTYLNIMSIHWHKLTARRKVQALVFPPSHSQPARFTWMGCGRLVHPFSVVPLLRTPNTHHTINSQITVISSRIERLRRHENPKAKTENEESDLCDTFFFSFFSCWIW